VQEKFKEMQGEFRTVKKKVKGKALRASVRIQSKLNPKATRDPQSPPPPEPTPPTPPTSE
jgi:hypothetical protein